MRGIGHDTPLSPLAPALQGAQPLWVESGRPLEEALDTHAMLARLKSQLWSPAGGPVPAVAMYWHVYGVRLVVCWN